MVNNNNNKLRFKYVFVPYESPENYGLKVRFQVMGNSLFII